MPWTFPPQDPSFLFPSQPSIYHILVLFYVCLFHIYHYPVPCTTRQDGPAAQPTRSQDTNSRSTFPEYLTTESTAVSRRYESTRQYLVYFAPTVYPSTIRSPTLHLCTKSHYPKPALRVTPTGNSRRHAMLCFERNG